MWSFRIRRHDGVYHWFDTRATPSRDAQGRIVKWIGSNSDIHQQRETSAAPRESEERLQAIIANFHEGLVVFDLKGRLLHWNPTALAMHGCSSVAECGQWLQDFEETFESSTLEGIILPFEQWPMRRILRGEKLKEYELRMRQLDSDWMRVFSYNGSLVHDAGGHPLVFLTVRDITAHKRAEAMLQGQKQVLEMIALGRPLAQTLETLVLFLEAQAPEMLCSILLVDSDCQHLRHGAAPRLPYNVEVRLQNKQGEYHWFLSRAQAEWESVGRPVRMAGAISDIHARNKAEAELEHERSQATAVLNSLSSHIAVVDRTAWCSP